MTSDPRGALATLIGALERHLEASASKRGEDDPAVVAAFEDVADAFEAYDEALLTAYGEMTPLDLYDDSEDEDEDGDDGEDGEIDDHYSDEDGEESIYSGLDDEEYDTDDDEDQTGS